MSASTTRATRASQILQRRLFLRAAALGVAAPAAFNLSRLAVAAPTAAPKRLMVFHIPHGAPNLHYNPKVTEGDMTQFTLTDSNVSILGPLEPYKKLVNVYQGFKYPEGGGPHFDAVHFLTNSSDITDTSPRLSFDHAIAQQLKVKPLVLGASSQPLGSIQPYSKVFWDGTGYVEAEKNPVKAADKVFGSLKAAPSGPDPEQEARKAILSLTAGEIQALQKELSSLTTEQSKLQAHLDAVLALREDTGSSGKVSCTTAPSLPNVDKIRALNMPDETASGTPNWYLGDYQGDNANFPLILSAHLELAAQALICNAAQIVDVQAMFSTSQQNFSFMGIARPHHLGISHVGPDMSVSTPSDPMVTEYAKAQRWFIEQLVKYVIEPLQVDDPAAPGTKVIDNTIIYITSEIADGQYHNLTSQDIPSYHPDATPYVRMYLPLVSVGGGGGGLKTQQVVRNAMDRPAADLYLTLAHAMGAPLTSFGASTGVVAGVLT